MNKLSRKAAAVAAGLILASVAAPALARSSGYKLSIKDGKFSQTYTAINGVNANVTESPNLKECYESTSCEVIEVDYAPSSKYHFATLTLAWDDAVNGANEPMDDASSVDETYVNPETGDVDGGSNDMDMVLYDIESARISDGATTVNPEVMHIIDQKPGKYFLTINNFSGANTGYTVAGELNSMTAPSRFVTPVNPPKQPKSKLSGTAAKPQVGGIVTAPGGLAPVVPAVAGEQIDRPGSDGPLQAMELGSVSSDQRAKPLGSGLSGFTIALIACVAIVSGGGLAVVVNAIKKDLVK